MSVRRSLLVLTAIMFVLPFVVFSSRANRTQERGSGQSLQFYTVARGDINLAVTAIGTVEAASVVNLSFTRAGRVVEVLVQPGDNVQVGQALVRLASNTEQIAYDQAELALELAQLRKQDLLEPADESEVRIAQANVDSAWGAYLAIQNSVTPESIQAAEIQVEQAQAAYDDAVYERTHAPGGRVEQFYQLLDAQVGAASFNLEIARLQLEALRSGNVGALNAAYARVVRAEKELEQVQAGPTQGEIDQADIAIEQAQADLDDAQRTLDQMTLFAPFDGLVSAVHVELGDLVSPGRAAVELTDLSALHVEADVDEIDIRQVHEGMPATIRLDAIPDVGFAATLNRIGLVGNDQDGIVTYDVEVTLNEVDPRARVGMTAEAAIIVERREQVIVVPNLYIRLDRTRDQAFVNLVQPDGTLNEVEVTLGLQGQDSSEVVSGLQVGDVVAVDLSSDRISFLGG